MSFRSPNEPVVNGDDRLRRRIVASVQHLLLTPPGTPFGKTVKAIRWYGSPSGHVVPLIGFFARRMAWQRRLQT